MALLYEEIEGAFKFVPRPQLPLYIKENLKHDLREYQTRALQKFSFTSRIQTMKR